MRHQRAGVHLSRTSAHRKALFSNLVAALFTNERIRTTDAKARETRRLAERTITWARRLGDVLTKKAERRTPEEAARVVHAVRMARRIVRDRGAVMRLFEEIGPRYLSRAGGYTRIVKLSQRPGDAAPMALLELMPDETAAATKPASAKGEGGTKPAGKKDVSPGAEKPSTKEASQATAGEPKASKPRAKTAKPKAAAPAPSDAKDDENK